MDVTDQGRMAMVRDPVGAQFGLWQGRATSAARSSTNPGALVRNDLVDADSRAGPAFYAEVFGFTLDANAGPARNSTSRSCAGRTATRSAGSWACRPSGPAWSTTFEVADTDAVVEQARAGGGQAGEPEDFVYGRMATVTDPFGAEFSVIARPS